MKHWWEQPVLTNVQYIWGEKKQNIVVLVLTWSLWGNTCVVNVNVLEEEDTWHIETTTKHCYIITQKLLSFTQNRFKLLNVQGLQNRPHNQNNAVNFWPQPRSWNLYFGFASQERQTSWTNNSLPYWNDFVPCDLRRVVLRCKLSWLLSAFHQPVFHIPFSFSCTTDAFDSQKRHPKAWKRKYAFNKTCFFFSRQSLLFWLPWTDHQIARLDMRKKYPFMIVCDIFLHVKLLPILLVQSFTKRVAILTWVQYWAHQDPYLL